MLLPLTVVEVFVFLIVMSSRFVSERDGAQTSAFSQLAHSSLEAFRPELDLISPSSLVPSLVLPVPQIVSTLPFFTYLHHSVSISCLCGLQVVLIWCSTSRKSDRVIFGGSGGKWQDVEVVLICSEASVFFFLVRHKVNEKVGFPPRAYWDSKSRKIPQVRWPWELRVYCNRSKHIFIILLTQQSQHHQKDRRGKYTQQNQMQKCLLFPG